MNEEIKKPFLVEKSFEGIHACLIYNNDKERKKIISEFLGKGLSNDEKVAYVVDTMPVEDVHDWLMSIGVDIQQSDDKREPFDIFRTEDFYCPKGRFVPEDIFNNLSTYYQSIIREGYSGIRASGEMSWSQKDFPGSERLIEYEAGLNELFVKFQIKTICQYDARLFGGDIILNVLKVHPFIVFEGQIVRNPYFEDPKQFLREYKRSKQIRKISNIEKLRLNNRIYEILFEQSTNFIGLIDYEGNIIDANPAASELSGYSKEELKSLNIFSLMDEEDCLKLRNRIDELKHIGKQVQSTEYKIKCKNGNDAYIDVVSSVLYDQNKPFAILGIGQDITAKKSYEKEKRKIEAQLLSSQKMEVVGALAGGVAHDFNNLLTVIQGCTELVMTSVDKALPIYQDLQAIQGAAESAANLTRQLLIFSKKKPMVFSSKNLNEIINNLVKILKRTIGEDISLNIDLDPDLMNVYADQSEIEQVIMNLAVNAKDAMPEGGRLNIRTENVNIDDVYCQSYAEARPGIFICLTIEDSGIGMNQNTIQHIFEPLFSTKGPQKGTGLGLSVVESVIKQHEGWINVESELLKGATFKIYLPTFSDQSHNGVIKTNVIEDLKGRGEKILLVEDDQRMREFTMNLLNENGYIVTAASNAKEGMDLFVKNNGDFHLIFSDIILTDRNGIELVKEFRLIKPDIRILLSSGYTDEKVFWDEIKRKRFQYIQKPYKPYDLLRSIRENVTFAKMRD